MPGPDRDVAFVTGASRGIGAACAEAFAQAGHDVAVMARTGAALTGVVQRCEAHGARVLAMALDVSDEAAVAAKVRSDPGVARARCKAL